MITFTTMESPIGPLAPVQSGKGLTHILFRDEIEFAEELIHKNFPYEPIQKNKSKLEIVVRQLQEYFDGNRKKFDIPLDLIAPPFYKKALKAVYTIPYGKTVSYRDVAAMAGNPKAARAAGSANANNPIPIIIPCHRVLDSGGGLGGYGGGLDIKKFLLKLEGAI